MSAFKGAQHAVRGVVSLLFLHKESRSVDLRWFSADVAPMVGSLCDVMHVALRRLALLANEISVRIATRFGCWLALLTTIRLGVALLATSMLTITRRGLLRFTVCIQRGKGALSQVVEEAEAALLSFFFPSL